MEILHHYRTIDVELWDRRGHFELFGRGEYPFIGMTTMIDITRMAHRCRRTGEGLFTSLVYVIMREINAIENFRYRLFENQIIVCDRVDPCINIVDNDRGGFHFAAVELKGSLAEFSDEMETAKSVPPGGAQPCNRIDIVSIACLPWFGAGDLLQPMGLSVNPSIPRVVWGGQQQNGRYVSIPFSITGHHGLFDGMHISVLLTNIATAMENMDIDG